jgi:hypothetical protein
MKKVDTSMLNKQISLVYKAIAMAHDLTVQERDELYGLCDMLSTIYEDTTGSGVCSLEEK